MMKIGKTKTSSPQNRYLYVKKYKISIASGIVVILADTWFSKYCDTVAF